METLPEIIMGIVTKGTLCTAGNKKASLWARTSLILVLLLFFGSIVAGSFLTGIVIVKKGGLFKDLIILDISILMLGVLMELIVGYRKNWE